MESNSEQSKDEWIKSFEIKRELKDIVGNAIKGVYMQEQKRCIFHIPNYLDSRIVSGSTLRPRKMLEAFCQEGYHVEYIMGNGKERKKQIKQIKRNIQQGIKYEFLYSESSTMPTLLTEKNHLPFFPFLDFGFFKFCKRNGIKIGLFYRDIYWKFSGYKEDVLWMKRICAIPMYKYDLLEYKKYVDKLYLPSELMKEYIGINLSYGELPPGCEMDISYQTKKRVKWQEDREGKNLRLFYVGGVKQLYDLTKLLKAIKDLDFVELTICCRENEWKDWSIQYEPYMTKRINVIHKSGEELDEYYINADICMLFFSSEGYRKFAMPIKLFEYIGKLTPIIAVEGSAAGTFVDKTNSGWVIPYKENALCDLLQSIYLKPGMLFEKQKQIMQTASDNTWQKRAQQVILDLSK